MKKKIKVVTCFDSGNKNDSGAYVQAAVDGKGVIHVLRTGNFPFIPEAEPRPATVYERLKEVIEKECIKFAFPSIAEMITAQDGDYKKRVMGDFVVPTKNSHRPPSTHKRVFRRGRRIKTMAALDKHLAAGGWIFWGTQKRAVHPGWVMSWQYQMVRNSLGRMWKAVKI